MTALPETVSADVRRERIISLLAEHEFVRVTDLAEQFGVSSVTIRADLDALGEQRAIRRVRGGAMLARPPQSVEPSFEVSLGSAALEKTLIAKAAAQLVSNGESIIIDAGTTATFVARELAARATLTDVVVFTNGLRTALELEPAIPRFSVLVTGGTLRPAKHSLVDPLGAPMLERIHADTIFLGAHGIHPKAGVTSLNLQEAEMKSRMIQAAARRILVADSSKLGNVELAPVCLLNDIHLLITGNHADPAVVTALRDQGMEIELIGV
ncbi:DeoR/GlpR family DNA-binding transcription regulator [Dactylosporangium sp. NPDC048998]|uniref:DeoR/GlpR family DNA-binding transcription regulator n=1 Tax=Dactylosporangium sp. NPDC048998 TaxID=3363976 RepID=UPI003715FA85